MSCDKITFVAAEYRSDCLRQVSPSDVCSAEIVRVGAAYQLIATLNGVQGAWRMSSPGGLVDTLPNPKLFERFIEVVLCHLGEDQRLAA